jgi:uncharacterized Ntn-hydrolase superfamily protein
MTFSIAARDAQTGWLGIATSSKALAAGAMVPYVELGVGAIASQSFVNPYLGLDGLRLLADGMPAERAIERLIEGDPGRDVRQLGIVDKEGRAAAYTGTKCIAWAGHQIGGGYVALGNMLSNENVVPAIATAFERSGGDPLYERLMLALEAGQEAGGDRRGRQSAAIYIIGEEEYPFCDLRVDDHADPVQELRRVLGVYEKEMVPFMQAEPKRNDFTPLWDLVMRERDRMEEELSEKEAVKES